VLESTALGAALLAGLAVGLWSGMDELAATREFDRVFEPSMPEAERAGRLRGWKRAVTRSMGWAAAD
jgi:glycerol kinase